jgi:hypothetical protein
LLPNFLETLYTITAAIISPLSLIRNANGLVDVDTLIIDYGREGAFGGRAWLRCDNRMIKERVTIQQSRLAGKHETHIKRPTGKIPPEMLSRAC